MCNKLHHDSQPIPEKGVGWKLFFNHGGVLHNFVDIYRGYKGTSRRSVGWRERSTGWRGRSTAWYSKPRHDEHLRGFCFFRTKPSKKTVKHIIDRMYSSHQRKHGVLCKIEYSGGLGEHMERSFISGKAYKIALCKQFSLPKANTRYRLTP